MALIKDRKAPKDVPVTSDTLANIVDPDAVPPAEIRAFGKTLLTVAQPPEPGETIVVLMRLRVYDVGTEFNENGEGEGTPYRKMKLVSCWTPGSTEPQPKKTKADEDAEAEKAAAENQPPLFEEDEPGTDAEDADEYHDDPEALGELLGGVDRPGFSDADE